MVSLNRASSAFPTALHIEVHKVFAASKDVEHWYGSPLETALAAVALSKHGISYREDAFKALEATTNWAPELGDASTSAEAASLALAALASANLQRSDPSLVKKATESVASVAMRDASLIPDLHLTLCAWALEGLVRDKTATPWPQLLRRFQIGSAGGVDVVLRTYGEAIAARNFDGSRLVARLTEAVLSNPLLSDVAILLWILNASIEKLLPSLTEGDPTLDLLMRHRSELVERLLVSISNESPLFDSQEIGTNRISILEALLVDVALPATEQDPFLNSWEAKTLFGHHWKRERAKSSALIASLGITLAVCIMLLGKVVEYPVGLNLSVAVSISSIAMFLAVRRWLETGAGHGWRSVSVFLATLALLGIVSTVNQSLKKPFIDDVPTLIVGALVPAIAGLADAIRHRGESG